MNNRYNVFLLTFFSLILIAFIVQVVLIFNKPKLERQTSQLPASIITNYTQSNFINFLLPIIRKVNGNIAKKRKKLVQLYKKWRTKNTMNASEKNWLKNLAFDYEIKNFFVKNLSDWQKLLNRVDIVPAGLVLAQGINESGWGQSRFAKKANNFFGQYCYVKGCGIVAKQRPKGRIFELKKFSSPFTSVQGYMHNLNTNKNYLNFRLKRRKLRKENKTLSSLTLVDALENYSSRGSSYVKSIFNLLKEFKLDRYDKPLVTLNE